MRRRRWWAALAVGALLTCVAGAAAAADRLSGAADAPTAPAARITPNAPTLVIGDSALAALEWAPGARRAIVAFDPTLDVEACRRLYRPSCASPPPSTAFEALGLHGPGFETAVIAVGYNDVASITAEGFEAVVGRARSMGYTRIVWWTLRDFGSFRDRNAVIRELLASGRFPDVLVADWGAYTADRPEWFVSDGVHFRVIGAWAAADYLTRKLAYLDGRACPLAVSPAVAAEDPCPDPDVTGPVADLAALYPIGGG